MDEERTGETPLGRRWPLVVVALVCGFNLVALRAEALAVSYPNDGAIHSSMVRWAALRMREGHLPFDGWYPFLSLGASRFHHYQSLPHILTGAASIVVGPGAYRWSLYLLLALWPVAVYAGARLFEIDAPAAAMAAVISPLVASAPGLGFEWGSYVWRGYGVWAQLWGMWALPFAWALGWRAVSGRASLALGALAIGITLCLHLLTGYLGLLSIAVWVLVAPGELRRRTWRAVMVGLGALAIAAWMLVPLVVDSGWTIRDEFSTGTYFYDSFGAKRVLTWLVRGQLFDAGRLPIVSLLVAAGTILAVVRWRGSEGLRAITGVGALSMLLFFGRPTLGAALRLLPGGGDLFLRRYIIGVHLVGIWLAGAAAAWLLVHAFAWLRARPRLHPRVAVATVVVVTLIAIAPALGERFAYAKQSGRWIAEQRIADATDGSALRSLVGRARALGPGRIYAGRRSEGSNALAVGRVPAYAWLLTTDADAVGFTRPTWSLMSGAEARFRTSDPGHVPLFGIRYEVTSSDSRPNVPAFFVAAAGPYALWKVAGEGYLRVVDTSGSIAASRDDLGSAAQAFLDSSGPEDARYPTIAFGGRPAAPPSLPAGTSVQGGPGTVLAERPMSADGVFEGVVHANRDAVVAVSASFDPRWHAWVDGRPEPTQMLAPALLGVAVPPGEHHVRFTYAPIPWYAGLLALGASALLGLVLVDRRASKRRASMPLSTPTSHRYASSAADSRGA